LPSGFEVPSAIRDVCSGQADARGPVRFRRSTQLRDGFGVDLGQELGGWFELIQSDQAAGPGHSPITGCPDQSYAPVAARVVRQFGHASDHIVHDNRPRIECVRSCKAHQALVDHTGRLCCAHEGFGDAKANMAIAYKELVGSISGRWTVDRRSYLRSGSAKTYSALPVHGMRTSGMIVRGTTRGLPPPVAPVVTATN